MLSAFFSRILIQLVGLELRAFQHIDRERFVVIVLLVLADGAETLAIEVELTREPGSGFALGDAT